MSLFSEGRTTLEAECCFAIDVIASPSVDVPGLCIKAASSGVRSPLKASDLRFLGPSSCSVRAILALSKGVT